MALDTRYRPRKYSDVLGQESSVLILRQLLKEGKGYHQSYVFCGQHGSGKCVTGDTLVPTDRGLVPILSLMGTNQIDPLDVLVVQESGNSRAAYSYRDGERDTIRITTHNGFTLEGTPAHRIRVMDESGVIVWRALGDIRKGDYACIVRRGLFGSGADLGAWSYTPSHKIHNEVRFDAPSTLDPDWGRLIGYMIGDGSCTSKQGITISCADTEILSDLEHLFESKVGSFSLTKDKRRVGLYSVRAHRVQVRHWLAYAGVGYDSAGSKEIPWSILASPESVVRQFLRGYFEADGHVSKSGVEVTTKSERLSRQIQIALLNFGVVSSRRPRNHSKYGVYWRVSISGFSISDFSERVGFVSRRKQDALEALAAQKNAKSGRINNRWEVVPHQQKRVQELYARIAGTPRAGDLCRCRFGFGCTRRVIHELAALTGVGAEFDHFRNLRDADYFYDAVTTINAGRAEVYDLNVPDGAMFASNGFMSHNTTMGRILARALLCSAPVDGEPCDACESCLAILQGKQHECFTELDAATKSTKEDMLKITEDIQYSSFSGKRRIYLFDESHRLSKSALDAVLKPMEDCISGTEDKQLVCIFCTTEPEKMQPTIFSRCAPAFVIKAVTPEGIADRLAWVCAQEGINYEHDALVTIAEVTECHIRDALKTLEGVSVLGTVSRANVTSYLGLGSNDLILDLLDAIGLDQAAVVRAALALAESTSPTSAYERLAEASLTAYRAHIGVGKIQAHWPQDRIKALAEKGAQLLAVSSRFSAPPKRPTSHTLLLDAAAVHNGIVHGVSSEAVVVTVAKAAPAPASVAPASAVPEKVMPAGNVGINAPKPSANAVVQVDPRAVGGGASKRRVQTNSTAPASALDADAFRNLVGFHYRRLTSAGST